VTSSLSEPSAVPDAAALRDLAVEVVTSAGALLTQRRAADLELDTKSSPTDLVTVMDRAAERLVIDGLQAARPDDPILAEETGVRPGAGPVRWIVDPLDGTVNYAYGIPAYGVSVAAEVDGTVVAGAVFSAIAGGVYEAVAGGGARFDGRPLHCSDADELALSLVGTGFAYAAERRAVQGEVVSRLLPQVRDIRRIGAAALDLCAVADGLLDAYYETGLKPWDRAAGLLIATESGARTAIVQTHAGEVTVAAAADVFDALMTRLVALHAS
jgi:myo-inositol-1(or 4)-monophosphatase